MTVLRNVRIWDGVSESYAQFDSLRIEGERIAAIGEAPDSRDARDFSGLTLLPGLIDGHVHLCLDPDIRAPADQPSGDAVRDAMPARLRRMAAAGITTARDLGGGEWIDLEMRDRLAAGELVGPRLVCSGQPITSPGGHCHFWGGEASDTEQALAVLERQVEHGVDLIKVMATGGSLTPGSQPVDPQFPQPVLEAVVEAAGAHGRHVAAHCHGTAGIRNAANAGVRTIEHCSWVGTAGWHTDYSHEVAESIAKGGAFVSPTINSGWKRNLGRQDYEARVGANFDRMREAGVRLMASTDAGIPGVYHHDLPGALPYFSHFARLSPVETLRTATSNGAEAIGLGEVTGRIEVGLAADLLVVDGDPLVDLNVLAAPAHVVARGRFVEQN